MPGNEFKLTSFGRRKRLTLIPGVFAIRQNPEVAVRVQNNPLPARSVHVKGHVKFPYRDHVVSLFRTWLVGSDNANRMPTEQPPSRALEFGAQSGKSSHSLQAAARSEGK